MYFGSYALMTGEPHDYSRLPSHFEETVYFGEAGSETLAYQKHGRPHDKPEVLSRLHARIKDQFAGVYHKDSKKKRIKKEGEPEKVIVELEKPKTMGKLAEFTDEEFYYGFIGIVQPTYKPVNIKAWNLCMEAFLWNDYTERFRHIPRLNLELVMDEANPESYTTIRRNANNLEGFFST